MDCQNTKTEEQILKHVDSIDYEYFFCSECKCVFEQYPNIVDHHLKVIAELIEFQGQPLIPKYIPSKISMVDQFDSNQTEFDDSQNVINQNQVNASPLNRNFQKTPKRKLELLGIDFLYEFLSNPAKKIKLF